MGAIGAAVLTLTCGVDAPKPQEPAPPVPAWHIVEPTSYDGEVFYFPVTGDDYRASLSAFRKAHPALHCQYFGADDQIVGTGYALHSHIVGHTIVCTDTDVNAQEETVP